MGKGEYRLTGQMQVGGEKVPVWEADPKLVLVVAPMTRVVGYENGAIACQGVN